MSFILAGIVTALALFIAYLFLTAGDGTYAKSDAAQALLIGLFIAAVIAGTHWIGW